MPKSLPYALVLVYAWNEFGEGGYIAPTRGDSEGRYLKAIKAVLSEVTRTTPAPQGRQPK